MFSSAGGRKPRRGGEDPRRNSEAVETLLHLGVALLACRHLHRDFSPMLKVPAGKQWHARHKEGEMLRPKNAQARSPGDRAWDD